jgi:hypothetical protein
MRNTLLSGTTFLWVVLVGIGSCAILPCLWPTTSPDIAVGNVVAESQPTGTHGESVSGTQAYGLRSSEERKEAEESWASAMHDMQDHDLSIKVRRLQQARAERREMVDEFDRSQQIFLQHARAGRPLDPSTAQAAQERGEKLMQYAFHMSEYIFRLSREANDRFADLTMRELGIAERRAKTSNG